MAKYERRPATASRTKDYDPIEGVAIDAALNTFRNMLFDEYERRFKTGEGSENIRAALSSTGVRFEVHFKGISNDTGLLINRIKKELSYIASSYYELFATYKELAVTMNTVFTYSDIDNSVQYRRKAEKYIKSLSELSPGRGYDEQEKLRSTAINILKSIVESPDIVRVGRRDNKELDTRKVMLNIALVELKRLESEAELVSGYIDTYKEILDKTLNMLNLSLKKRDVPNSK
ncbi:MAG: hypothetical protein ACP5MZ_01575 [Candidatus Micrarchaeia archaeon]